MFYTVIKLGLTAILVVAVSEAAKRSSLVGAVLASIPLVSVLAMIWLYVDTRDAEKVASLATSIFWLVLPSLVLLIALPILLPSLLGYFGAMNQARARIAHNVTVAYLNDDAAAREAARAAMLAVARWSRWACATCAPACSAAP